MAFGNPITRFVFNNSPAYVRNLMTSVYSKQRGKAKFGNKFEEYLTDLQRLQWYSNKELCVIQKEKLHKILWYAYNHVPYYNTAFKQYNCLSMNITDEDIFSMLPVLEKSTVQANFKQFRSSLYNDNDQVELIHSSGTTGKAIDVCVDKNYLKLEKAYLWLQRSWRDLKVKDSTAYFTGHPVVPVKNKKPPFWVYDRSENRTMFSLQHMSESNLFYYRKELEKIKPKMIVGYPTAIYLMASYLLENKGLSVKPEGIYTASETLFDYQREIIENAFSCKVYDLYGQTEYCGMIMQCDKGCYHIQENYGYIELLNRDGKKVLPGEVGEIIATGLNNFAMPFIRYRTGDMAILKDGICSCGRGGRLVERITGRVEDVIITPDGRFLSRLDFVFKELNYIKEAQIIQEKKDLIRIRVVPNRVITTGEKNVIVKNMLGRTGQNVKIFIDEVDSIPRLSNGKFRYVISKVPFEICGIQQVGNMIGTSEEEEKRCDM